MAYKLNDISYPSVTTITGILDNPALIGWAANCAVDYIEERLETILDSEDVHAVEDILKEARNAHRNIAQEAATAGKLTHKAIEKYIHGATKKQIDDIISEDKRAENGYKAFKEWERTNHVKWIKTECVVYSQIYGYAGRFDAIAEINGELTLIDFKTSSGVYDEMKLQICAYMQAYNETLEEGEQPVNNLGILHLNKETGEPVYYPVIHEIPRKIALFNTLTYAYYLQKDRRLKNNKFVKAAKEMGDEIPKIKKEVF